MKLCNAASKLRRGGAHGRSDRRGIEYAYPEIDFGTDEVPDLEELMARLQAQGKRVVRIRYIGQPAWLILRHKELYDAFMDSAHYPCSAAHLRHSSPVMGKSILCLDGDEHRIKRALVASAFLPSAVRGYTERLLRPIANRLIDGFAGRASSTWSRSTRGACRCSSSRGFSACRTRTSGS